MDIFKIRAFALVALMLIIVLEKIEERLKVWTKLLKTYIV